MTPTNSPLQVDTLLNTPDTTVIPDSFTEPVTGPGAPTIAPTPDLNLPAIGVPDPSQLGIDLSRYGLGPAKPTKPPTQQQIAQAVDKDILDYVNKQNKAYKTSTQKLVDQTRPELLGEEESKQAKIYTDAGFDYLRGRDNEATAASQQGFTTRLLNDLGNVGTNALGTVAAWPFSWWNLGKAVGKALQGDYSGNWAGFTETLRGEEGSTLWAINKWQDEQNQKFTNFRSDWARNHENQNLLPIYGGEGGTDFGNLMRSAGYIVGSVATSAVETGLLGLAGVATEGLGWAAIPAKLSANFYRATQGLESIGKTLDYLDDAFKTARTLGRTPIAIKALDGGNKIWQGSKPLLHGFLVSNGESSLEAYMAEKESLDSLLLKYKEQTGKEASGKDLEALKAQSRTIGNSVYLMNQSLLSISNTWQLGNIMKNFPGARRALGQLEANPLFKRVADAFDDAPYTIERKAGSAVYSASKKEIKPVTFGFNEKWFESGFGKYVGYTGAYAKQAGKHLLVGNASEGLEEGLQKVISEGNKYYYEHAYDQNSLLDLQAALTAAKHGFGEAFGTREGLTEVLAGVLVGGIAGGGIQAITNLSTGQQKKQAAYFNQLANQMNLGKDALQEVYQNKVSDQLFASTQKANAAFSMGKGMLQAAQQQDQFAYQNKKNTAQFGFLNPFVQKGTGDVLREQMDTWRATIDRDINEFTSSFGLNLEGTEKEQQAQAREMVDTLEGHLKYLEKSHDRKSLLYNNPYVGQTDAESKIKSAYWNLYYQELLHADFQREMQLTRYKALASDIQSAGATYKGEAATSLQQANQDKHVPTISDFTSADGLEDYLQSLGNEEIEIEKGLEQQLFDTTEANKIDPPKTNADGTTNAKERADQQKQLDAALNQIRLDHEAANKARKQQITKEKDTLTKLKAKNYPFDETVQKLFEILTGPSFSINLDTVDALKQLLQKVSDADLLNESITQLKDRINWLSGKESFDAFTKQLKSFQKTLADHQAVADQDIKSKELNDFYAQVKQSGWSGKQSPVEIMAQISKWWATNPVDPKSVDDFKTWLTAQNPVPAAQPVVTTPLPVQPVIQPNPTPAPKSQGNKFQPGQFIRLEENGQPVYYRVAANQVAIPQNDGSTILGYELQKLQVNPQNNKIVQQATVVELVTDADLQKAVVVPLSPITTQAAPTPAPVAPQPVTPSATPPQPAEKQPVNPLERIKEIDEALSKTADPDEKANLEGQRAQLFGEMVLANPRPDYNSWDKNRLEKGIENLNRSISFLNTRNTLTGNPFQDELTEMQERLKLMETALAKLAVPPPTPVTPVTPVTPTATGKDKNNPLLYIKKLITQYDPSKSESQATNQERNLQTLRKWIADVSFWDKGTLTIQETEEYKEHKKQEAASGVGFYFQGTVKHSHIPGIVITRGTHEMVITHPSLPHPIVHSLDGYTLDESKLDKTKLDADPVVADQLVSQLKELLKNQKNLTAILMEAQNGYYGTANQKPDWTYTELRNFLLSQKLNWSIELDHANTMTYRQDWSTTDDGLTSLDQINQNVLPKAANGTSGYVLVNDFFDGIRLETTNPKMDNKPIEEAFKQFKANNGGNLPFSQYMVTVNNKGGYNFHPVLAKSAPLSIGKLIGEAVAAFKKGQAYTFTDPVTGEVKTLQNIHEFNEWFMKPEQKGGKGGFYIYTQNDTKIVVSLVEPIKKEDAFDSKVAIPLQRILDSLNMAELPGSYVNLSHWETTLNQVEETVSFETLLESKGNELVKANKITQKQLDHVLEVLRKDVGKGRTWARTIAFHATKLVSRTVKDEDGTVEKDPMTLMIEVIPNDKTDATGKKTDIKFVTLKTIDLASVTSFEEIWKAAQEGFQKFGQGTTKYLGQGILDDMRNTELPTTAQALRFNTRHGDILSNLSKLGTLATPDVYDNTVLTFSLQSGNPPTAMQTEPEVIVTQAAKPATTEPAGAVTTTVQGLTPEEQKEYDDLSEKDFMEGLTPEEELRFKELSKIKQSTINYVGTTKITLEGSGPAPKAYKLDIDKLEAMVQEHLKKCP